MSSLLSEFSIASWGGKLQGGEEATIHNLALHTFGSADVRVDVLGWMPEAVIIELLPVCHRMRIDGDWLFVHIEQWLYFCEIS